MVLCKAVKRVGGEGMEDEEEEEEQQRTHDLKQSSDLSQCLRIE